MIGICRTLALLAAFGLVLLVPATPASAVVTFSSGVDEPVAGTLGAPAPVTGTSHTNASPPVPPVGTVGISALSITGGSDFGLGTSPLAPSCSAAQLLADETRCPLGSQVGIATLDLDLAGTPQHLDLAVFNADGGQSLNALMTSSSPIPVRVIATETRDLGGQRLTLYLPASITEPQPGVFAHLVDYVNTIGPGAGAPGSWISSVGCGGTWSYTGEMTFSNAATASGLATQPCSQGPGYAGGGTPPIATSAAADGIGDQGATLHGTVNPNATITTYLFQYGPTTSYGSITLSKLAESSANLQPASAAISGLAPGTEVHFRIVAVNASGTTYGGDQTFVTTGGPAGGTAIPTPRAEPAATLPSPVFRRSANLAPVEGSVLVRLPGSKLFVPLQDARTVPAGTVVDATKGRVTLTSAANANGTTQAADFYGGKFRINLLAGTPAITELALVGGDFSGCPSSGRAQSAAKKKKGGDKRVVRSLWGDGKGTFRTRGRYGAATVRGTRWLTEDRCDATRLKVTRGTITATDLPRNKRIPLRTGRQYLARPRR